MKTKQIVSFPNLLLLANCYLTPAFLYLALFILIGTGCGKDDGTDPVVARVGKAKLTLSEVNQMIPKEVSEQITSEQKKDMVEKWVESQLLYQEALRRGIEKEPRIRRLIEKSKMDLVVNEFTEKEFEQDSKITEDKIQKFYQEHLQDFIREDTEMHVRHILVPTYEEALEARRRITKGERFEDIAREVSIDPSAADGGDLGYLSQEIADADLWRAASRLKVGETSSILRTESGYQILELIDRKEKGTPKDLEQVRAEIINELSTARQRRGLDNLLKQLRSKTKCEINTGLLKKTGGR